MEDEDGQSQKAVRRDSRGLREARPAAPGKTVASNPHYKVRRLSATCLELVSQ